MKILPYFAILSALLTAGCTAARPWMTYRGPDGVIQYSEYFDSKPLIAEGNVRAHIIITLGKERLPVGARISDPVVPSGKLTRRDYRDGLFEAVSEIYLTNLSSEPITIQHLSLQTTGFKPSELTPTTITIQQHAFVKTDPVVEIGSLYKREYPFVLSYTFKGKEMTIRGTVPRVKVQDIGRY